MGQASPSTGCARTGARIDALNVFPVPDGDTGTNMYLTLEAGVARRCASSSPRRRHLGNAAAGRRLARGALLGARGNSGVIMSELLRGVAATRAADLERDLDGSWLADALARASSAAFSAVANPQEGTVLTVARAAAEAAAAAAEETGGQLLAVAQAAAHGAADALAETTDQLEALRRAGVVDAGGRGYVVLTDSLLEVVTGCIATCRSSPAWLRSPTPCPGPSTWSTATAGPPTR